MRIGGRIVMVLVGGAFVGLGTASLVGLGHTWAAVRRMRQSPMVLAVDLSRPGLYRGTYNQIRTPAEGTDVCIVHKGDAKVPVGTRPSLLDGLKATIIIREGSGKPVFQKRYAAATNGINDICVFALEDGTRVPALRLERADFPVGAYQFEILVEDGAPHLAGVPHELVVRYEPAFLPLIAWVAVLGTVILLASGATLLCFVVVRRRAKPKRHINDY